MTRDINVNITPGSIVKGSLFIVLLFFLYYIRDIVLVVLAAVVIASAIEPATRWFKKYHVRRLPAVILIYLGLILIIASFLLFLMPTLLGQSLTYLNSIPSSFNLGDIWAPLGGNGFLANSTISTQDVINNLQQIISGSSAGAFRTASFIFGGALSLFLIIILSFYLAVQEDGVENFLRIVTPVKSHAYVIGLWKRSQTKIGHWMQGQLLLGLIIGMLVYLGLMVLGISHALLLAFVAAFFELIPVFGPIISAIPAVLIALASSGLSEGLLVIGLYLIIHQFENNLLYPLVVKKIVGVSPILVILALVIGAKLAGFLGAILAVPIAAALMELVHDIDKDKRRDGEMLGDMLGHVEEMPIKVGPLQS